MSKYGHQWKNQEGKWLCQACGVRSKPSNVHDPCPKVLVEKDNREQGKHEKEI